LALDDLDRPGGRNRVPDRVDFLLTSRATVPCSPMRGVTVRTTPASRYSTDCVPTTAVVVPPVGTAPPIGSCWLVTIGTDSETLMTAFLFSDVRMCGLETMLPRFWAASVLSIAKNLPVWNVKAVRPAETGPNAPAGGKIDDGDATLPPPAVGAAPKPNLPERTAQSMPRLRSSFSVISAASTSISTCLGIRSR